MLKEFKAFAMRGNVLDMAVGIIIGGAFGKIISSLVSDVLMPPIGAIVGNIDFSKLALSLRAPVGERRAGGDPLRPLHERDYRFPDRRLRHLPAHPPGEQADDEAGPGRRADDARLPRVPLGDPDQGAQVRPLRLAGVAPERRLRRATIRQARLDKRRSALRSCRPRIRRRRRHSRLARPCDTPPPISRGIPRPALRRCGRGILHWGPVREPRAGALATR